ncbi:MAG: YeeE/YedE family protein [Bacteroidales bacterium]|nr:YeeE/YedE family protein [Bacteroidales bacterium]
MTWIILLFGFLFGIILRYAKLNRTDVITGNALLKDFTVIKTLLAAIGVGAVLLSIEIALGLAGFHAKPFVLGGIVIGGILFGMGMGILGYCPGTMAISLGEGALDALFGILGGLLGGFIFTLVYPTIKPILGPNYGSISLYSLTQNHPVLYFILVVVLSAMFVFLAFTLHKAEQKTNTEKKLNHRWLYSGITLAILNGIVFLKATTNRPIGASTSYPYVSDFITGLTNNTYFHKVSMPGHWEFIFLAGAFLSALIFSLLGGSFKLRAVYSVWEKTKGPSVTKRLVWAFIGGFILLLGARTAGGCTSGHILSGGMQYAVSSLVFGVIVFSTFIVTGKLFYKK